MHTIQEHPTFGRLKTQRFLIGTTSMILSLVTLYVVLCLSIKPDLDSNIGVDFDWVYWNGDGWWEVLLAMGVMAFATFKATGSMVESDKMIQIHPPSLEADSLAYDVERIRNNALKLASDMGVTVEEIYIATESVPNAFATVAIERGDIMVIHTNLIDILDEASLNSIIAHELGHMAGNDVLHKVGSSLPKRLAQILLVIVYVKLTGILLLSENFMQVVYRSFGLGVVLVLAQLWMGLTTRVDLMYSRCKEKMADMYGAFYVSVEASINSFVRLNARSHALEAFVNALKERKHIDMTTLASAVDYFPYDNPNPDFVSKVAPQCYIKAHIKQLCQALAIELPDVVEVDLVQRFMEYYVPLTADEVGEVEEGNTEIPFSWKMFDHNQDGILQRDEILDMLNELDSNPSALTDDEGDSGTHPSNRTRITFLAETFGLKSK